MKLMEDTEAFISKINELIELNMEKINQITTGKAKSLYN